MKGFPAVSPPPTVGEWLAGRPSLFSAGFLPPVAVLRRTAIEHNLTVMADFCASRGLALAPHGKTTMAPQLYAMQLAAGAWGITAATIGQVRLYRAYGVSRVLLANELTDPAGIAWLAQERTRDPGFEFSCYVDSPAGVEALDRGLRERPVGRRLPVLVELGFAGGRTGCRTPAEALGLARAVAGSRALRVGGVAGYEGGLGGQASPEVLGAVREYLEGLRALGRAVRDAGLADPGEPFLVSAGGSAFVDVVADVLGSGCYLIHDHGLYARLDPFARVPGGPGPLQPALEVWAHVLSRPEPGLALINLGRRDVSFDNGLPVPLRIRDAGGTEVAATGLEVTRLDDQHGYVSVPPGAALAVGDLIAVGISHPCTTFDKWRWIPMVDGDYRVVDCIRTFF
jgi:D-serine deaminase-like pyridoxal phosphate-dependent protein